MRLRRLAAAVFTAALVLAACGDDGSSTDVAASDDTVQIPDIDVLAVDTGDTVNVRTLAQGQDVLFWFYAPH